MTNTRDLYDRSADNWGREEQLLLSDFTARPRVLEAVGDVSGLTVWDLGCGEGFVGRRLAMGKPARVEGFDLSPEMIRLANAQAGALSAEAGGPLHYRAVDLSDPEQFPDGDCDVAIAVFLFNYLTVAEMQSVMSRVRTALRAEGTFAFTVPHPSLAFLRPTQPPFYIEPKQHTYLGSRDVTFQGRIWRRDGVSNEIRSVHKTFTDYFSALKNAGWSRLPEVEELGVTQEHLDTDPEFFTPLSGMPLHILFRLCK